MLSLTLVIYIHCIVNSISKRICQGTSNVPVEIEAITTLFHRSYDEGLHPVCVRKI